METTHRRDRRRRLPAVDVRSRCEHHVQPVRREGRTAAAVPHRAARACSRSSPRRSRRVVPLDELRWITFGHVEADECGAMNQFLAAAPNATVAHGAIACMVQVNDLADRAPHPLGRRRSPRPRRPAVRNIDTPHIPHGWDAHVHLRGDDAHAVLRRSLHALRRERADHDRRHRRSRARRPNVRRRRPRSRPRPRRRSGSSPSSTSTRSR